MKLSFLSAIFCTILVCLGCFCLSGQVGEVLNKMLNKMLSHSAL